MKNTLIKLKSTQYVIYDKEKDSINENLIIYGNRADAINNLSCWNSGTEAISCTKLPTHKQVELLKHLRNEI